MTTVRAEFERLSRLFDRLGCPIKTAGATSEKQLASISAVTGINVDDSLKDLWRISNGSRLYRWFADGEDEDFTPHVFLSIKDVLSSWRMFSPYDEKIYSEWYDDESWGERDPRIQRHLLRHRKWLAIAEFLGGSDVLQFDADPTPEGQYGQIILFSHDPDSIFWCETSFLSFFKKSNDLLEDLASDPEFLADKLELVKSHSPHPGLLAPETCHNVKFNFDGIVVTWPESAKGAATEGRSGQDPSPTQNSYAIYDSQFTLSMERGHLSFADDGLEFEFGKINPGDQVRVAGYNEIYVNNVLREPDSQ